ncbi:uncharacterized protein LOC133782333 [Humulus lupulus]|uniref:uncharacterized protein LOC133782333 n=1 Tax=Humulus lupulus TaxID=3486 RepID=UPI002B412CF9|nr:uncharacterized protein LOC133782333 [Humulus lupulus]
MKVGSYEMDESESDEEDEMCFEYDKFCYEGLSFSDFRTSRMMRVNTDEEITKSYEELGNRTQGLEEAKRKISSYTPGSWIEKVDSMKLSDYDVPRTTSLMLVGPKGSGKTSLINRISKVFEDDKFAPERAQVSYKDTVEEPNHSYVGDGTLFLHKYMIPRESSSFCLYDTRSLSDYSHENIITLEHWMTKGVRHGELVMRESDSQNLRTRMKLKAFKKGCMSSEKNKVNFVIFVVNGHSVLKAMRSKGEDTHYVKLIASAFNCPFVSFRDDRPLLVVTHGDLLGIFERVYIRLYLGKILGISPTKQIFDIPAADTPDPETDVLIVDMLRSALEQADKNLPPKTFMNKVLSPFQSSTMRLLMVVLVVIAILFAMVFRGHILQIFGLRPNFHEVWPKQDIQWHKIRHLWLDDLH